jgi:hypothetical protein
VESRLLFGSQVDKGKPMRFVSIVNYSLFLGEIAMSTKKFCSIYILLIVLCLFFSSFEYLDIYNRTANMIFAVFLVFISIIPQIIGMILAYKNILVKAWTWIVCYWFCAMCLGLVPYGVFMTPQCILWSWLCSITDLSVYHSAVYCARIYFISSLVLLPFLFYKREKHVATTESTVQIKSIDT